MNEKQIGTAGEYLACFNAMKNGHYAYMTTSGCEYDICVEVNDIIYKVQVKSSTYSRSKSNKSLSFTIARRNKVVSKYNVDIFALVDIKAEKVAWFWSKDLGSHRKSVKKKDFKNYNINNL